MQVDPESPEGPYIGRVEIVEDDDDLAAVAGGAGAMLIAGPNVVSVVPEDHVPVVREQPFVGEHLARLRAIERGPVRAAVTLGNEAPRASPKVLELRGQGGGDPRMLGKQALGVGVAWGALPGGERDVYVEAFELGMHGTAIVALEVTERDGERFAGRDGCGHLDAHPTATRGHRIVGRVLVQEQRATGVERAGRRVGRHRATVNGRSASVKSGAIPSYAAFAREASARATRYVSGSSAVRSFSPARIFTSVSRK